MDNPSLFPDLFASFPPPVNSVLKSVLRISALEDIYAEARMRDAGRFTQSVLDVLRVGIDVCPRDLARIPKSGPLVIVANHPFGILDGAVLDAILTSIRPDTKLLTNQILCNMQETAGRFLPIDVFGPPGAQVNLRSIRITCRTLSEGGAVAIFPAGEVSHWISGEKSITDPAWNTLPVRCSKHADAPVVPVFFVGANSVAFQLAGMVHPALRTCRLPRELLNKQGCMISVRIGKPVPASQLNKYASDEAATQYLRARVYMLQHRRSAEPAPRPFTRHLTDALRVKPIATETAGIALEIERLKLAGHCILETPQYEVYSHTGESIPAILREIGRLRELTFRGAGEGSGKALDLDPFDSFYTHVLLWHKAKACIAGAYRLTWTEDILPSRGIAGLYTSTLFRYMPEFFERLGPCVELGRSFIRQEFQRDYAPLLLLWQAIAQRVARRPASPVLFGAVSISASYSEAARNLIFRFLSGNCYCDDLCDLVTAKAPFRSRLTRKSELSLVSECLQDVDELPIGDIDDRQGVPVLLRQYLRLGGRVAAFNVDRKFSNALDGLLIVDLRRTPPKLLGRYMGQELSQEFLKFHEVPAIQQAPAHLGVPKS